MIPARFDRTVVLIGALAATLAAAAPPPPSLDTRAMRAETQKVLAATWKGGVDVLRVSLNAQTRQRPSDPLPRVLLAFCSFPSDDAWNQFKAVAQLYPDNPWAHLGMGLVYVAWKMRDPAKTEFELALKADPAFYPALVGLGDLAALKEDWPAAQAAYQKALTLADDAQARAGLGFALQGQGQADAARAELEKSYALWKDQPRVVQELFAAAREKKDLARAADYAEQLAALKSRDRAARRQLADLRFELGEKDKAALEYERLLRLGNPELEVVDRLVALYRALGQPEKEEAVLYQRSGLAKADSAPSLRLAELARARNNLEGAEGHLLEAVARDPRCAPAHLELAHLRKAKGVLHEAVLSLRAAAAVDGPSKQQAADELLALEKSLKLSARQARGSPDAIYNQVAAGLNALYLERKAQKAGLAGELKLRVRVDAAGAVEGVDILSDTVGDPVLAGHLYLALRAAEFPKQKREPVFEFELGKAAKKK